MQEIDNACRKAFVTMHYTAVTIVLTSQLRQKNRVTARHGFTEAEFMSGFASSVCMMIPIAGSC